MNCKTATLMGAAAALAASPALAAPSAAEAAAVPVASSYAQLLEPVPNAVERLRIADSDTAAPPARLIEAQYNQHHNHHHQNHNRRWYMQNGYIWSGGAWVLRPRHHHHHQNHSHN
jgi:hypothetical protein